MRGAAIWLVVSALLCCAAPAMAETKADMLKRTIDELEAQQAEAKQVGKKREQAEKELEGLQKESGSLVDAIRTKHARISDSRKELERLEREQRAKQALLGDRREHLEKLVSGMIRMRRIPAHYVAAQPADMPRLLQTASALDITYRATQQAFVAIEQEYAQLEVVSARLKSQQKALDGELQSVQSQQNDLTKLIRQRREAQQLLQRDHTRITRRVRELSDKSGDLQELIARLEAETTLFPKEAVPQAKPNAPKTEVASAPTPAIAAQKGKLPYPVQGSLLHKFGDAREGGDRFQGIELRTESRAPVTAPHGGKVVFSGTFMDYGPMVILAHDDAYHSVIAGLDVVAVELGQTVSRRDLLGTMGTTAVSRTLYYELRKHSKAIDPAAWMGNVNLATRN